MTGPLRAAMVGLVLVSLGFVQITEAARWIWLGPLVALTLASPWLVRFTRYLAYRTLWNLAVIAVFALLVRSFLESGVHRLLEHGLMLAAFCQVHLINNLGERQKPDLLFFNSFLIAVVTSYLSLELAYFVTFLVFAPLFVIGLQLLALSRAGAETTPALLWRTVRQGVVRGGVVLGVTLVVFFLMPRDFTRKGLLGDRIKLKSPKGVAEVDFSDKVSLDRSGEVRVSDRIALRVHIERGERSAVPAYWRGATLDWFDGAQWRRARSIALPGAMDPWQRAGGGELRRVRGARSAAVTVTLEDRDPGQLFAPLDARRLKLVPPAHRMRVSAMRDLTLRCTWGGLDRRRVSYLLEIDRPTRRHGGTIRSMLQAPVYLYVKPGTLPAAAAGLADSLRRELTPLAPQHKVVEKMRAHLAASWPYLRPGEAGGATDLVDFFESGRGGHCEVFATALALMLRSEGIPCRLVTGYRSEEWNDKETTLTIRARHAHAWVEVLDPSAGWYTVDPTPAIADEGGFSAAGVVAWIKAKASGLWAAIASFNEGARVRVFAWLAELPRRAWNRFRARPTATMLAIAGLALAVIWWRLQRVRLPKAVLLYERCLRRMRLRRGPGETPRQLLARVELEPRKLALLEAATGEHERARYHRAP